jgi:hypothetical protein
MLAQVKPRHREVEQLCPVEFVRTVAIPERRDDKFSPARFHSTPLCLGLRKGMKNLFLICRHVHQRYKRAYIVLLTFR